MLKNIFFALIGALVGGVLCFTLMIEAYRGGWLVVFPAPGKQLEVLSLLLSAATLLITVVAVLLALAGVLGYTFIKEEAIAAAVKRAVPKAQASAQEGVAPLIARAEVTMASAAAGTEGTTDQIKNALTRGDSDDGKSAN